MCKPHKDERQKSSRQHWRRKEWVEWQRVKEAKNEDTA